MTFVQEEKQAKYSGMPGSAISTGLVDYILPVEKMPGVIAGLANHPYFRVPDKIVVEGKEIDNNLQKIFLSGLHPPIPL